MYLRFAAALTVAALTSGCAIHPEPEDVTGVSTAHIVKQIRCETRDAARELIRRELTRLANDGDNFVARNLLEEYAADPEKMSNFDANRLFPYRDEAPLRSIFNLIYSAGIAYTFTLTMNEQNDLGTTFNFLGPWANRFNLGVTGNANRARENERTFTITDKFSFLLRELNSKNFATGLRYCDGHVKLGPNYIYPIAGQIGVYKTVYTFFQMAIFDGLAPKPGSPAGSTPAMADKLTFTTVLDLSVTPRVLFAQSGPGFQVFDGSGTGLARRRDVHQVLVGVALEPTGPVALEYLRGTVFSGAGISAATTAAGRRRGADIIVVGNRVTASTTSGAERLAVQIIDQVKSKELQLIPPPNQ